MRPSPTMPTVRPQTPGVEALAPAAGHREVVIVHHVAGEADHEAKRVVGHGLVVRPRPDRDDGVIARCCGHVDLVVADAETRDQTQIGRRRENPLGIGFPARHGCKHAGQRRDQLFFRQEPAACIHDQLKTGVPQTPQEGRLAAIELVDVDQDSAAGHGNLLSISASA